jgi:hypothetical protein
MTITDFELGQIEVSVIKPLLDLWMYHQPEREG